MADDSPCQQFFTSFSEKRYLKGKRLFSELFTVLRLNKTFYIMMKDELTITMGNTQYKVEERLEGLWSGGPEICIAHILDGKRSRTNPSIPLDQIPKLIEYLAKAYGNMGEDLAIQKDKPVV